MNIYYYYMNPCALAFHNWASQREFHPSDKNKFFRFVNTVCNFYKTQGIKWHNKDFFEKECTKYKISIEDINYFYNILDTIVLYKIVHKNASSISKKKKPEIINKNCKNQYFQIGLYNGSLIKLEITKEEFEKNGIGEKKFLERLSKAEPKV